MSLLGMAGLFLCQAILANMFDPSRTPYQQIYYNLLNLPLLTVQAAGPAVLLATVLTLSGLSRTSELVACYSIGVSLKRIFGIFLVVVLIISSSVLWMEDRVLPAFFKVRMNYYMREMRKQQDFFLDMKLDKIWYRSKNMIYNLQRFDDRLKTIYGMSIYTFDEDFNLVQMIEAERAEFDQGRWTLLNGTVTLFITDSQFPMTQEFKTKRVQIEETPLDFQEIEKEVDGLRSIDLLSYINRIKAAGADTKSYEVKLQSRFSLSFIPIVLCFLAVPFSIGGRREGRGVRDLVLCLGITFFYWLFYSISLSLGTNGALPPWLAAWLPSLVFVVLAATLIARKV
jgi:lipopolysaccharide export system permease protein